MKILLIAFFMLSGCAIHQYPGYSTVPVVSVYTPPVYINPYPLYPFYNSINIWTGPRYNYGYYHHYGHYGHHR